MDPNIRNMLRLNNRNIHNCFLLSVTIILFAAAMVKLSGATAKAHILDQHDPMLFLSNRAIFRLVATAELLLSAYLLVGRDQKTKLFLIAGYSTICVLYRVELQVTGVPNLFSCIGNLIEVVSISPRFVDRITVTLLGWMLFGSYGLLVSLWFSYHRKVWMASDQEYLKIERSNFAMPIARRLVLGWGAGAVLYGLIVGGLYLRDRASLPRHLGARLNEIYFNGEFRDAPVSNHAGTALLYAQDSTTGIDIFLLDLKTLQRTCLQTVKAADMAQVRAFKLCGWSPDDRYVAFAVAQADRRDRHLVLCDGNTGRQEYSFDVDDSVEQGTWLSTNCLILLDHSENLYSFDAVGRKSPIKLRQLGSGNPTYSLVADSDQSIAYTDDGNVWTLNISDRQPLQLTHLTNSTLQWLDYSKNSKQYLFGCQNPITKGKRFLYKFNPLAGTNAQLALLVANDVLNGRWLQDGNGYAWVGTDRKGNFLAVEAADPALRTNLFNWSLYGDTGDVRAYGISPKGDKLYAIGAVYSYYCGDNIWEYNVASRTLRNVTPGMHPAVYSQQIVSVQAWTTNSSGNRVDYFYVPPGGLNPHKRYPMVMTQYSWGRYDQNSQAMANAGIFCVSQNYYGQDSLSPSSPDFQNTLAVYRDMLRNPNVDPHRIYICGESASSTGACQLVETYPDLWRGLILLSPVSFPNPMERRLQSVFISEGDEEELTLQAYCERTIQEADAHLIRAELAYGHAGHIFSSTQQLKQRYQAMTEFILTDF